MISSKLRLAFLLVAPVLLTFSAARAAYEAIGNTSSAGEPYQLATGVQSAGPGSADVLQTIPADSILCVRINNFEQTVGMMDQFLGGIMPMPFMLSSGLRAQLSGLLGNPQLPGIDMNGSFALFVVPTQRAMEPNAPPVVGVLVPVTDYNLLVNGNPNVSQQDAQGVCQVTAEGFPPVIVKQAGGFALLGSADQREMLAATAEAIATGRLAPLAASMEPSETRAPEPVWVYIKPKEALELAMPAVQEQIKAAEPPTGRLGGIPPGPVEPTDQIQPGQILRPTGPSPGLADAGQMPMMPGIADGGLKELGENVEVKSIVLTLNPTPSVLTISARITAIPGTKAAQDLSRGSPALRQIAEKLGAKEPGLMGPEFSAVSTLLPSAGQADFAGTFNLMKLLALAAALAPIPVPVPDANVPVSSSIAYAIAADAGKMRVDVAVPKEHINEIAAALKEVKIEIKPGEMMAGGPGQDEAILSAAGGGGVFAGDGEPEPDDEVSMITASPFGEFRQAEQPKAPEVTISGPSLEPSGGVLVGGPGESLGGMLGGPGDAGSQPRPGDQRVRIVGARLVSYSDPELGILPLGQREGYTLSLVADLPEPAVKIVGGWINKAVTNTGASLLPDGQWDRRIRFGRLSKDFKMAVFDVELKLPDVGATALEELSGTLEYMTASGSRQVDLGVVDLKEGARGSQLAARISSIVADPYRNNATVVTLRLELGGNLAESVELYDTDGTKLAASQGGFTTVGDTVLVKLSIDGQPPARARIVARIFEGLQKKELGFTIASVLLTGQPLR